MRLRLLGIGMGPSQVTTEVAEAIRGVDYVVAFQKREEDPLIEVRRQICAEYGVPLVTVADPARDRDNPSDYGKAVRDWHDARAAKLADVFTERGGTAAILVWGDPSLYDSYDRLIARLEEQGTTIDWDVLPGISAPSLLAAKHRIVLHRVSEPVLITTGRRLRDDIGAGAGNLVVMLNTDVDLTGFEDWQIWWGANLGCAGERLVAGRAGEVADEIATAREAARTEAGFMMDLYLLRGPQ